MKIHTTNYFNTFIQVSDDTKAIIGTRPPSKENKTVAEMQFELITESPYKHTSDEILFQVYAMRNDISETEYMQAREEFFSKGQPCFRTSPLTKTYGFGVHYDQYGKIAVYGVETVEYQEFLLDATIKKLKAMKASK